MFVINAWVMKYVHMQLNIRVLLHSLWEHCFYPWEDTSQSKSYHSFVICVDHCPSCDKGPPGVFFGWVCAARDSKLAPRSIKNFPLTWYPVLEMGQFFILRSRLQQEHNSLLVNGVNTLNRIFKINLSLNTFKWLLTKAELLCVRNFIPRSRKRLWNGYPVLNQELQSHDPVGRHVPV